MTPRRSKIDRLTASKSMFERDRFAESLAAVSSEKFYPLVPQNKPLVIKIKRMAKLKYF